MSNVSSIIDPSSENNGITHARINALQSAEIVSGLIHVEDQVSKRVASWLHAAATFLAGSFERRIRHHRGHSIARLMLEADERLLQDIGLSRADVRLVLKTRSPLDPTKRLRILSVERRAVQKADQKRLSCHLGTLLPDPLKPSGRLNRPGAAMRATTR